MNPTDLTLLRNLDAAPDVPLEPTQLLRSGARLEQILASDPDHPETGNALAPVRRRVRPRWVAIPAVAAAVLAVGVVAPQLTGLDAAAYASWTPQPSELSRADHSVADDACRDEGLDLRAPRLDLAERRGEWVALLYTSGTDPMATTCMARLPVGSDHAEHVDLGRAGGQGAVPVGDQFTQGPIFQNGGKRPFGLGNRPIISITLGDVGKEVAGVTITTAAGQQVEATVANGRYVVWWPGYAFDPDFDAPSGEGGPEPTFTYTVTLTDGTVIEDADYVSPE